MLWCGWAFAAENESGPCLVFSLLQYGNGHLLVVQQCSKLPLIVRQDETRTHTNLNLQTHTVHKNDLSLVTEIHVFCLWLVLYMLRGESDRGQRGIELLAWGWGGLWIHIVDTIKCLEDTHTLYVWPAQSTLSHRNYVYTLLICNSKLSYGTNTMQPHLYFQATTLVKTEISQQLLSRLLWNFAQTFMFSRGQS